MQGLCATIVNRIPNTRLLCRASPDSQALDSVMATLEAVVAADTAIAGVAAVAIMTTKPTTL